MSLTTPATCTHPREPRPRGPAVGRDEWVARTGERRPRGGGWIGEIEERLRRVPWWACLTLFVAVGALMPAFESSGYVRLVGFETASTCCLRSA